MDKTIEEIICGHLVSLYADDEKIARYCGLPAVFNTNAPDDTDVFWESENQFPRIIFELNMQADAERKVSGRLFVDVMCLNTLEDVSPEEMEAAVKAAVDGCFFSNQKMTISAQWNRSDAFNQKDSEVVGTTMTFDVMAYPVQETENPDPVLAVNLWMKTLYQNGYVIGRDTLPEVWKPTDESPAFYCRLSGLSESTRIKSTAAVTWIGADMNINVMAPSEHIRSTISKSLIQILTNATRLILNDGSPMLIDKMTVKTAGDPLREGQIQIKATYGVLNEYNGITIKRAGINGLHAEMEVSNG